MPYLVIGLIASAVSVARLYVTDNEVFTELVWAEDGLFPLCVANHGYWDCLWDPYAGYLLFLSRTLAVPVAYTPLDSWPLSTNLVAAVSYGAMSALIYWLLVKIPLPRVVAGFSALVPVVLPITGLEAINTAGSLYMVLLVAATIAVSASFQRPVPEWVLPTLLLITALTIPVALVLALPLGIRYFRKTIALRQLLAAMIGLIIGSAFQFAVIISATGQRPVSVTSSSVGGWIDGSATAVVGLLGIRMEPIATDTLNWTDSGFSLPLGLTLASIPALLGLAMVSRPKLEFPALLMLTGSVLSAVTAIPSMNSNRYYVTFSVLIVLAVVVALVQSGKKSLHITAAVVAGVLMGLWMSHLPASSLRATPEPRWSYMLEETRARCAAEAERVDTVLRFTPVWPPNNLSLTPLNQPLIPC